MKRSSKPWRNHAPRPHGDRRERDNHGTRPGVHRATCEKGPFNLHELAVRALRERGMAAEFSPQALSQLSQIDGPASPDADVRDLRDLAWASIDNDDSRDLDQVTVAVPADGEAIRVLVAVADVDALVTLNSPLDQHACENTVTVYTPGGNFPMLPTRLSNDLTSLNYSADRVAVIVDLTVDANGHVGASDIYRGLVRNKAKLVYEEVSEWLTKGGPIPGVSQEVEGLGDLLRLQHKAALRLREARRQAGSLQLKTIEPRSKVEESPEGESLVVSLEDVVDTQAHHIIEALMVAANEVVARYLHSHGQPTMRRVVRKPRNWDRIVSVAAEYGTVLPGAPEPKPLSDFLAARLKADPKRFPDLSLTIVKLLGPGEYVVEHPGRSAEGHFGLAVRDYSHSTAPNRRYPDIISHRILKATLRGTACPYALPALDALAEHCTRREDDARKVERQLHKSAAALYLMRRVGQEFRGIITGAAPKGTYVRLLQVPAEGRVMGGETRLAVGDEVRVRLIGVDVEHGYLDFNVLGRITSGHARRRR